MQTLITCVTSCHFLSRFVTVCNGNNKRSNALKRYVTGWSRETFKNRRITLVNFLFDILIFLNFFYLLCLKNVTDSTSLSMFRILLKYDSVKNKAKINDEDIVTKNDCIHP
jgi:hypothetical protein